MLRWKIYSRVKKKKKKKKDKKMENLIKKKKKKKKKQIKKSWQIKYALCPIYWFST